MCMFYFKYTKNSIEENKYNRLFSIDACRYSYEDFIAILHQVYLFDTSKTVTKKGLIKKEYIQYSNQLNHPYFSEAYLLNYFN